ncbi:MAG: HIT domain-containing protein ['Candidatus Kapabacteria' thiocyanatum]|uniref:Rhodanese domain-containing protein n=1 Tax=Candidatus Kapaibacterium thiocyanatum TaxID=1895771 RepID=A0A1M3KVT7_9BACT|nr:HIT domain-containing protein ['Candidatus Kapabacteria' thiocyanatum]OJX56336.1 MAG: hypothetical protein BGO89_13460 ['Candidatus Kapabacteria' thiocyanatum]
MDKSIFSKIIDREVPATIEYEDERVIAIRDIAPSAPIHLLIIPKKHIASANAITEEDAPLIGHVFMVAQQLARRFNVDHDGYRVVTNVNANGGQTVFHLHFHLLGGEPLGRMNSRNTGHGGASSSGTLREAGLLILMAIGLAIGFNTMNPKRINWVKPVFERVQATEAEIERLLGASGKDTARQIAAIPPERKDTAIASLDKPETPVTTKSATPGTTTPPETPPARQQEPFRPEPGVVREVGLSAFRTLLKSPHLLLIDARIPESYAKGHIAGAINIDGNSAEAEIPRILQLPQDRIVVIYCDGGECELSHHVAETMKKFNFGPIFIYTGGWAEWSKQ